MITITWINDSGVGTASSSCKLSDSDFDTLVDAWRNSPANFAGADAESFAPVNRRKAVEVLSSSILTRIIADLSKVAEAEEVAKAVSAIRAKHSIKVDISDNQ